MLKHKKKWCFYHEETQKQQKNFNTITTTHTIFNNNRNTSGNHPRQHNK